MSPRKIPCIPEAKLLKLRRALHTVEVLPPRFWKCYSTGTFENSKQLLEKDLSEYGELLSGLTLVESLKFPNHYNFDDQGLFDDQQEFVVNVVVVKECFIVSLHSDSSKYSLIGCAFHSKFATVLECSNHQLTYHPLAKEIILRIKEELAGKGIAVSEVIKRRISSEYFLNLLVCSILWRDYIKKNRVDSSKQRLEEVSKTTQLSPATVLARGVYSPFSEVRNEANKLAVSLQKERDLKRLSEKKNSKELLAFVQSLKGESILPEEFWSAFENGIYPKQIRADIAYHVEKYANLSEGWLFVHTKYLYNYVINLISTKGAFFVSIHSKRDRVNLLGNIDYNPFNFKPRQSMTYVEKRMNDNLPAYHILHKIRRELAQKGLEIGVASYSGSANVLRFFGSINRLYFSALWKKMLTEKGVKDEDIPNFDNEGIAQELSESFNEGESDPDRYVAPMTVAHYAYQAPDRLVKRSSHYAGNIIRLKLLDLESLVLDYKSLKDFRTFVELLSKKLGKSPIYISSLLYLSKNKAIKKRAHKLWKVLLFEHHDVENNYIKLKALYPTKTPSELAIALSEKLGKSPYYLLRLGMMTTDSKLRKEMTEGANLLACQANNITEYWDEYQDFDPFTIIELISDLTGKSTIAIACYSKGSDRSHIERNADYVFKVIMDKKHDITEQWEELIANSVGVSVDDRVNWICKKTRLSPRYVADIGKTSPNDLVKKEAFKFTFDNL